MEEGTISLGDEFMIIRRSVQLIKQHGSLSARDGNPNPFPSHLGKSITQFRGKLLPDPDDQKLHPPEPPRQIINRFRDSRVLIMKTIISKVVIYHINNETHS